MCHKKLKRKIIELYREFVAEARAGHIVGYGDILDLIAEEEVHRMDNPPVKHKECCSYRNREDDRYLIPWGRAPEADDGEEDYVVFNAVISANPFPSVLYPLGETISVKVTLHLTKGSRRIESIIFRELPNGAPFLPENVGESGNFSTPFIEIDHNTIITAKVTDGIVTKVYIVEYIFQLPYYIGVIDHQTPVAEDVVHLQKRTSPPSTVSYGFSGDGVYPVVIVPAEWDEFSTIKEQNEIVVNNMFAKGTLDINDAQYRYYVLSISEPIYTEGGQFIITFYIT
jgi:hypothetical protein